MRTKSTGITRIHAVLGAAIILVGAFAAFGQKEYSIAIIQGDKNMSAYAGQSLRATGIVTARTRSGFFIQTPDKLADSNPNTSEGIFVFTKNEPVADAAIGSLVSITGMVTEYRPKAEPATLPITEISMRQGTDLVQVLSKENELPKPIALTIDDFKSNKIDQLERFEGMRVTVPEMTVISPTGGRVDGKTDVATSSGTFYGVVKGLARPFRDVGYNLYDYVFLTDKEKEDFAKANPKIGLFDCNPERLRIESTAQLGSAPIDVPALTELKNIVGVMHFAYQTNTILLDPKTRPSVSSYSRQVNLPPATDRQFTIAGMNLENFFDDQDDPNIKEDVVNSDAFNKRLKKISMAIRDVMKSPDVIGTVEVENLAVLKRLAEKLNADTQAAGKPNPNYEAYLIDGNDARGIDVGFLVKASRIKVLETKQFGKDEKFTNPSISEEAFLNDRPPLMLRASILDTKTNKPVEFTVVVNHLKSLLGYDDPKRMDGVRLKKRLQAEFLAKWVQERQKANPNENIALVGDFNAFQFNDGILDVIGTIKGKPSPKGVVINPSDDLVDPDMTDLVDLINPTQRYSYTYRDEGNAETIDHVIITEAFRRYVSGFGFARVNADFPEAYRNDEKRPERYSDHDAAVAYFTLYDPAPVAAPRPTAPTKP